MGRSGCSVLLRLAHMTAKARHWQLCGEQLRGAGAWGGQDSLRPVGLELGRWHETYLQQELVGHARFISGWVVRGPCPRSCPPGSVLLLCRGGVGVRRPRGWRQGWSAAVASVAGGDGGGG